LIFKHFDIKKIRSLKFPIFKIFHFGNKKFIRKENIFNCKIQGSVPSEPVLLQTRTAGSIFTTRTVQVQCQSRSLNSEFCHILIVPFSGGGTGMVYGWIGRCCDSREARIMGDIMDNHLPIQYQRYSKQVLNEGEEPENFFWVGIGADLRNGAPEYQQDADFLRKARLFRYKAEFGLKIAKYGQKSSSIFRKFCCFLACCNELQKKFKEKMPACKKLQRKIRSKKLRLKIRSKNKKKWNFGVAVRTYKKMYL